jgi:hypothetical protein
LDLFRGLHREHLVGSHWSWKVQFYFGVDGRSHADGWYKSKGVNHYLIRPGVVKRDCYIAPCYDGKTFDYEIGFVGSTTYHPEHVWRPWLIAKLRETYGSRFVKHGNPESTLRGTALNEFYARCKVVVGDTCHLEGNHDYWSDRLYEGPGRGAFQLMPFVEGMEKEFTPGIDMDFYEIGDWPSLKAKIDHWLVNDEEREDMRLDAHERCNYDHTYHSRMKQLLETVLP